MTIAQTSEQTPAAEEKLEGYIPPPTDLIFDDGEPLESNRHRIAMNLLIRSLKHAWSQRNDFYTGGNMFIYYSSNQARNRNFRGPDFFVVLDTDGTRERQGWVVWEEDGRYPDVIVELMSSSTANQDTGPKKDIYERIFHTSNYFVYHPFQPQSLQGWHLNGEQRYQPLQPNEQGWLWCEKLGFWLGIWQGTLERETAPWLRFFDPQGNLILLPEEAAELEAQQAQQQAQQAQQQAEQAQQQAEQAQQQAQQAQQQAQQAQQRAAELEALLNRYKQQFGELPE